MDKGCREHATRKNGRPRLPSANVKLYVIVIVVLLGCFSLGTCVVRHFITGETCNFDLPEEAGNLTFRRIGIHPFLAEYSREVVLTRANGTGTVHPLCMNIGGSTYINVYWIKSNEREFVRLDDAYGEYLLDVHNDEMYLVVRVYGRAFIARLESETPSITWGMDNNDPTTAQVDVDEKPAIPLESLTDDSTGQYLGVISEGIGTLKFRSASECPEQRISKPFEP